MPDPRAFVREYMLNSRAQQSFNPAESGNNERVPNMYFHVFDTDQTYNGEDFSAGDVLFGDNSDNFDNIVYKSGVFQVRTGKTTIATLSYLGLRLVGGGLIFQQQSISATLTGNVELTLNGTEIVSSNILIASASAGFTLDSIAKPLGPTGFFLIITNTTAENMTLTNDYATPSTGFWSIHTYTGSDASTTGDGVAILLGNVAADRWDLISIRG